MFPQASREDVARMPEPLTVKDVLGLANVLAGISRGARVRWVHGNDIAEGVLRHLTGPDGSSRPNDVRDSYVRVTLLSGLDVYVPLTDLAAKSLRGEYAELAGE